MSRRGGFLVALATAGILTLTVLPGTASAVWGRGANGKIYFTAWINCCDELLAVNPADGTGHAEVVAVGQTDLHSIEFSPDATRIAFLGSENHGFPVLVQPIDPGGPAFGVLPIDPPFGTDGTPGHHFGAPVWAPDGSRVLFTVDGIGPNAGIWTLNKDGGDLTQILSYLGIDRGSARWSPEMTRIGFTIGSTNVYSVSADGAGPLTPLATNYPDPGREQAARSPNGERIAYIPTVGGHGAISNVFTSNLDGGDIQQLTHLEVDPGWSSATNAALECNGLQCPDSIVYWDAIPDHTGPMCMLTAIVPGPHKELDVTVQDTGAGIATIAHTETNATTAVPSFTPGTNDPLLIAASKTHPGLSSTLTLTVTDTVGNTTTCDPHWPAAKRAKYRPHR